MAVRADDDQYSVLCNVHGEGLDETQEFGRVTLQSCQQVNGPLK